MSYDLTIWKQSRAATYAELEATLAALEADEAHPTMQRFDADAFLRDVQAEFGGSSSWTDEGARPPLLIEAFDFTGTPANWVSLNIPFSNVSHVLPKVISVAARHGLAVYDFQKGELSGGR
jgi:hypothetical protein